MVYFLRTTTFFYGFKLYKLFQACRKKKKKILLILFLPQQKETYFYLLQIQCFNTKIVKVPFSVRVGYFEIFCLLNVKWYLS